MPLKSRNLTFLHSRIAFPLHGVHPWAYAGGCVHDYAMHDLFGQCILRSGSVCPSSHCVGVRVSVYCVSVLFCLD